MQTIDGIAVFGDPIPEAVEQIKNCVRAGGDSVAGAALMADHHIGYAMPIGGVVAYYDKVSPSGVGYDIACGNKAVRLDVSPDYARDSIANIMDRIYRQIAFGMGGERHDAHTNNIEHELFDDPAWDTDAVAAIYGDREELRELAQKQLGSVGSGNHYVDVFIDELDRVWVGVHFGSRGLGHKLASYFVKAGGGKDGMYVDPVLLDVHSDLGQEYIACMQLAGKYAYAGRDWVCSRVADMIGGTIVEEVHNHHNFAWRELGPWGDEDYWVIRKGATPCWAGQRGFIGGSMGDDAVIVEGIYPDNGYEAWPMQQALFSTIHGAGRVMSRTEAAGKYKGWGKKRRKVKDGAIEWPMVHEWLAARGGVELRGGGLDEAPQAYKRLEDVLAAHEGTIDILHTLTPIGVAMAPGKE